jgi:Zn-dependent protease
VLFAIAQPAALLGLLIAFLLALTLRVAAMRLTARALGLQPRPEGAGSLMLNPREDIDPFGAVAAAVAGTGWGRAIDIDAMPRWASRGRRAAVVAAGPLVPLLAGLLVLTAYRFAYPDAPLLGGISAALRGGWAPSVPAQFLLSVAAGLIGFGLLNLVPLPPLDGFSLLWVSMKHIGAAGERARGWLVDNNIGVVILLIMVFFPLTSPFIFLFIELLALPVLWIWS